MHPANSNLTISRRQAIKMMGLGAATTMAASYTFGSKPAKSQTVPSNSDRPSESTRSIGFTGLCIGLISILVVGIASVQFGVRDRSFTFN